MSINKAKALELLGGDEEMFAEICQLFLQHAPNQVQAIEQYLSAKDYENLSRVAHSLKSSAGSVGAEALRALAEQLEKDAKSANLEQVSPILQSLKDEFTRVIQELKG